MYGRRGAPDWSPALLEYPLAEVPTAGTAVTIAPGVDWLRIPLPGSLEFINVWALADGDGLAIVDTGMSTPEAVDAWRAAITGPLGGKPVSRVFVTHMHPDHIGLAGLFTRRYHCALWITRLEFLTCRTLAADTGREAPGDGIRYYRAAGWDEDMIGVYRARFGGFGKSLHALPDSFVRIREGDEVRIGEHVWRVVVGAGHSPEHACLYCPELDLLISGDQILPRISSNVAVNPTEPGANPLADWLESLARIRREVPDSVLVLPAHNDPFHGLHERIDALIEGHHKGLADLTDFLAEPRRAIDCFAVLFRRPITSANRNMATGETIAHLNYLMAQGVVRREVDSDGVAWYRRA